jgi:hypothetical protein
MSWRRWAPRVSDVVSNVTSASDMQCLIDQAIAGTAVWTAPSTTPASATGTGAMDVSEDYGTHGLRINAIAPPGPPLRR